MKLVTHRIGDLETNSDTAYIAAAITHHIGDLEKNLSLELTMS